MLSVFCDSGQCSGLPHQFRHEIKTIPAAVVTTYWCSFCVMKSELKELFLVQEESKKLLVVKPIYGYRVLSKLCGSNSTDSLDMKLFEYISSCIKLDLDLEGDNESNGTKACILSEDDNFLSSMHGTIALVPDGSCRMSAIEVNRIECFYCSKRNCHYQVQCNECEQFNCGGWIREAAKCAFCRKSMTC
jgi:hypothetical protein